MAYADRVEGLGTAGAPAGGVVTVQGAGGGGAITVTVSGTVAVTQSGAWTVAATQSGAWSVSITGTVAVTQSGAWSVSITGTPTVDTELPAAASLASDALAPANSPTVGAVLFALTSGGATYERPRSGGDDAASYSGGSVGRLVVRNSPYTYDELGAIWRRWIGDTNGVPWVSEKAANQSVTVTGGANAIATATLAAPGASLFHYITHISIRRVATAALAGGAILAVTTTNLNGRSWRTGRQASITVSTFDGGLLLDQEFVHPLKSDVANTATTIVCPAAGAAVSWQIVVDYFIAP